MRIGTGYSPRDRRRGWLPFLGPAPVACLGGGDALDQRVLRGDAARLVRRYPAWGKAGVSGFYARDEPEVYALCQTRLTQFPDVVVFRASDLDRAGIEVVGTFRTPHVTLAASTIDLLVERLIACPHTTLTNAYHEAEPQEEAP